MIKAIVHRYQAVFVFAVMVVIMGMIAYNSLPRESAPEIRRPLIFITTVYPGVSPRDIETLITEKIEAELDGLDGLEKLTSTSYEGMSQVVAEFRGNIDVELALRRSKERVDLAKPKLPDDAEEPVVKELDFSDQPILIVTVSNPDGLEKLERYVDNLEELIEAVPGVRDVVISGKMTREVEIAVDPLKLKHYGFALEDVKKTLRTEHVSIPGGTLKTPGRHYSLSVSGEIENPDEFGALVVEAKGVKARLDEVATVRFGYAEPESLARLNGEPAISLAVKKRSGENLLAIVDRIKERVAEAQGMMPPRTSLIYPYDESENIEAMVSDLENNILSALLLVLIVTLFFLGPINAAFVSLAIPFSMLISFFVLSVFGITLNMVVLFSLIIALGMLVDNGIVIVENIYRHAGLGKGRVEAAITGTSEIAWPIATSTLTTILAFFPIIFMPDIMGEFMSYLPKTVIIVLTSSLIVGLTITTAFCSRFLRVSGRQVEKMQSGSERFKKIQDRYEKMLRKALDRPWMTLGGMFAAVFIGMFLQSTMGREALFFPDLDPPVGFVKFRLPTGTPLSETDVFTAPHEAAISEIAKSYDSVQTTVGSSAGHQGGARDPFRSQVRLNFQPFLERDVPATESLDKIRTSLAAVPGAEIKIEKMEGGPPRGNDISYKITGAEYEQMGAIAHRILAILKKYSSVLENIDTDFEAAKPELQIDIDREKARRLGLSTQTIASTVRTAMSGSKEGILTQGKKEYDINVRFARHARNHSDLIGGLEIVHEGKRIPLAEIATIKSGQTIAEIKRYKRERAVTVYADFKPDVAGKEKITGEVAKAVKAIPLTKGYSIGQGEGQEVRNRSTQFLLQAFMVAIFLIFLVLVIQFNSVSQPVIILVSVFLSLGGVFWGLFLTQQKFVIIMSGIGVISLAGVVVNNAIVLIDFINQLSRERESFVDAVVEAAVTRLRPVLLTAMTTVIGLLPMGFGVSIDFRTMSLQIGSESATWWAPMAWTIIYGLSFATVLTLLVVPCLTVIDRRIGARVRSWLGRTPRNNA